jgi:cytochrome P450
MEYTSYPSCSSTIDVAAASKATATKDSGPFVRSKVYMKALGDGTAQMELSSTFRQVTLEVISEVALNMNAEEAGFFPPLFEEVLEELNQRVFKPWRAITHGSSHKANVQRLNDFIAQKVAQRRESRKHLKNDLSNPPHSSSNSAATTLASPAAAEDSIYGGVSATGEGSGKSMSGKLIFADGSDMLDLLLDSIDAGVVLGDDQLCDQIKTQLLAGHETSSMMLTWATYLLVKHPEVLAKAVLEVDTVLGLADGVTESLAPDATHVAAPSFNSFRKLTFIEYVEAC